MKLMIRFFDFGALVFFIGMFLSVMVEVVSRNLIHAPTYWAEEASRFLCVWCVFFGSVSPWFRGSHIVIDVLLRRVSGLPKLILDKVVSILTATVLIVVWIGTLALIKSSFPLTTANLQISVSYYYLALLIGVSGMIVYHIKAMLSRGNERPEHETTIKKGV